MTKSWAISHHHYLFLRTSFCYYYCSSCYCCCCCCCCQMPSPPIYTIKPTTYSLNFFNYLFIHITCGLYDVSWSSNFINISMCMFSSFLTPLTTSTTHPLSYFYVLTLQHQTFRFIFYYSKQFSFIFIHFFFFVLFWLMKTN